MKPIDKMNKTELTALMTDSGLEIEEGDTVKSLKAKLRENGITSDEAPKQEYEEAIEEQVGKKKAESEDEVVVKITKDVTMYKFGRYIFGKNNRYVLMNKDDAELLLETNPGLFVKPTVDEIKRSFS